MNARLDILLRTLPRLFKTVMGLFLLSICVTTIAAPTPPVAHSHNGRVHNHSLPVQGLSHRHGAGSIGVKIHSTNRKGTIRSTVDYEPTKVVSNKNNKRNTVNRNDFTKGDTYCGKDQSNCNVCANNVQQQFNEAATGRLNWRVNAWRFSWSKPYPPNRKRPLDIFHSKKIFGIPTSHIQGFARTNSARFPYVGSHSHKRKGGVFVISQDANGKNKLATIHATKSRHPTGVQIIGNYLVYYDADDLVFRDLSSANHARHGSIKINQKDRYSAGGGLGMLRLVNNKLLLVTSGPGGQKTRQRYNYFYTIDTKNYLPSKMTFLNKSKVIKPTQWPEILSFSENLSLVTECGTGDVYSIHTTGDSGLRAFTGNGYWRLSKLNQKNGKLLLSPVNAFMTLQNITNCHSRSAATVSVNKQHKLEFNCHAFAKDPDGTLFDTSRRSSTGIDKFLFKTGTVR